MGRRGLEPGTRLARSRHANVVQVWRLSQQLATAPMLARVLICSLFLALAQALPRVRSNSCTPFHTTFSDLASSHFRPISDHESFEIASSGLHMFLDRPKGTVAKTNDGKTNDVLADGATMNSTYYMQCDHPVSRPRTT